MSDNKEIRWLGSSYDDLLKFPDDPRREAGFQLGRIQAGLDPDDWKAFASEFYGMDDGIASRLDRVKACGNGQVPEVAATAWKLLSERI